MELRQAQRKRAKIKLAMEGVSGDNKKNQFDDFK